MARFTARSDEARIRAEVERRVRLALAAAFDERVTLDEAARRLGISKRTAKREIASGLGPPGELTGRRVTFTSAEVTAWGEARAARRFVVRRVVSERARAALAAGRAKRLSAPPCRPEPATPQPKGEARCPPAASTTTHANGGGATCPETTLLNSLSGETRP